MRTPGVKTLATGCMLLLIACADQPETVMADHVPAGATTGVQILVHGKPDTNVSRLYDLVAGSSGIWATASGDYPLVGFDMLGDFSGGILRRGEGPDETGPVLSVSLDSRGNAVVWDSRRSQIQDSTSTSLSANIPG